MKRNEEMRRRELNRVGSGEKDLKEKAEILKRNGTEKREGERRRSRRDGGKAMLKEG